VINQFILKIKRKETPFYSFLHRTAKAVMGINFPMIRWLHLPLYYFDYLVKITVKGGFEFLWSVPLFKARCQAAGKNLHLPNGIPLILGSHLKIFLGDNVFIGRSTIGASKLFDEAVLKIGHNSGLGYGTIISVAKEVTIGDDCRIGPGCLIMDNDDHPVNPQRRVAKESVSPEDVHPVIIGNNVWIGAQCVILKGVTIGDNSVIAANSVVTRDVQENCIYAGYPARPTKRNIDKD
jgi:serine acetyltransferase